MLPAMLCQPLACSASNALSVLQIGASASDMHALQTGMHGIMHADNVCCLPHRSSVCGARKRANPVQFLPDEAVAGCN